MVPWTTLDLTPRCSPGNCTARIVSVDVFSTATEAPVASTTVSPTASPARTQQPWEAPCLARPWATDGGAPTEPVTEPPFSHGGLDGEFDHMLMLSSAGYYFYWTHTTAAVTGDPLVEMALRCAVDTCLGWMGVGFSTAGAMVGSHAIIGVPAIDTGPATVKEYLLGGKYASAVVPLADQHITEAAYYVADGFRTVRFVRPKTTAVYTIDDSVGTTQTVIYAFGGGAPLQFHRGMGTTAWSGGPSSPPTPAPSPSPTPAPTATEPTPSPTPAPAMMEPTLLPTPAPTATHTLSWGNDAVDAASITIGVGDTVRWVVDQQGGHNVVSGAAHGAPDGRFSSPWLANLNDEWTHTFDTAGRFPYYCNPHPWMVATILVEPCSGQPATSYCWGVRRSWGPEQS